VSAIRIGTVLMMALSCVGAAPADRIVHQKGRIFSFETMTVPRGEPVVFLNDDTVPHNVMSTSRDNAFDLGSQAPGTSTPVRFDTAGDVSVLCAIHPRMHLTISVKD
jgi:plastocyanin